MKKKFLIISLLLAVSAFSGCGVEVKMNGKEVVKKTDSSEASQQSESAAEQGSQNADDNDKITESSVVSEEKKEESSTVKPEDSAAQSSDSKSQDSEADTPADIEKPFTPIDYSDSFSFGNGGIKINSAIDQNADDELINVATDLYKLACETNWKYHIGCPYNLNYDDIILGEYEWEYKLVDDPAITSFADVENDYYKVFSEKYGNDLDEIYMEKDGNVYALAGERGADIFYQGFKIKNVSAKDDNEIFFTVENYYDASSGDPYIVPVEEDTFSIVKNGDNWRAGQFRLPY